MALLKPVLVQQMMLRDMEHGTSHHRYELYATALAYDNLTKQFYPDYETRSDKSIAF